MPKDMFSLTGIERVRELKALGLDWAKHEKKNIEALFFKEKAEKFEPIHKLQGA